MPRIAGWTSLTGQKTIRVIFGLIAIGVPFAIGASNILNHFYRDGAYLMDSGLLAYMMSPENSEMLMPPSLGGFSFFKFHVSPMLWLLSQVSGLLPLTPPQFFALFIGTCQALVAAAVFWALVGPVGLRGMGVAVASILAIAFANSGLAIAILRFPHYEILIVAATMLFLVALHERRHGLAMLFVLVALLTREDAGFHIAVTLAAIIAIRRWLGLDRRGEAVMIRFLVTAFLYSAVAMGLQRMAFPDQTSFARIYAGDPPFAHVTAELLASRVAGWLAYRSYIFLPCMVAASWAILRRNGYLMAGYAAALPWLVIHLAAISALAGTLSSYYGFPMMVASSWPLLGILQGSAVATTIMRREVVIGFSLMIAASFTALTVQHNPNGIGFAATFAPPPDMAAQHGVERALAALRESHWALGSVLADDGVVSLAPAVFKPAETFWGPAQPRHDTVIYFATGFQAREARQQARASRLTREYQVTGTNIRIVSDRRLESIHGLAPLIERDSHDSP
jgi:hypothetical protein